MNSMVPSLRNFSERSPLFFILIILSCTPVSALACDPCTLYGASHLQGATEDSFSLSVSEQFTEFHQDPDSKRNGPRDGELVEQFSTTHLGFRYDPRADLSLLFSIPVITRSFEEIRGYRRNRETDVGLGDVVLHTTYYPVMHRSAESSLFAALSFGVKLPTGKTTDLGPSFVKTDKASKDRGFRHHQLGSATGEGALTFGSGSYDLIFGANVLSRWDRLLFLAYGQYTLRTEGDYEYEFGDDFLWSIGPGYYFLTGHAGTLALRAALSGEHKPKDTRNGEKLSESDLSNIYLGPELIATLGEHWSGEVSVDIPISTKDSESEISPSWRLFASISYRF